MPSFLRLESPHSKRNERERERMTNESEEPDAPKSSNGNILTRSKPFQKLVDKVFKACDTSKTGSVSKSELYVGLLSIHITLARYAGPAACFVSSREFQKNNVCMASFILYQQDKTHLCLSVSTVIRSYFLFSSSSQQATLPRSQ